MTLALRMPLSMRSSGLRQRTQEAIERRNATKKARGYGPQAQTWQTGSSTWQIVDGPQGRSSSSEEWRHGRSSGSDDGRYWQSWQSEWRQWWS